MFISSSFFNWSNLYLHTSQVHPSQFWLAYLNSYHYSILMLMTSKPICKGTHTRHSSHWSRWKDDDDGLMGPRVWNDYCIMQGISFTFTRIQNICGQPANEMENLEPWVLLYTYVSSALLIQWHITHTTVFCPYLYTDGTIVHKNYSYKIGGNIPYLSKQKTTLRSATPPPAPTTQKKGR